MLRGPRRCGLLLASRWPLRPLRPRHFGLPWPERVICPPGAEVEVHTAHVPPGSSNGWVKVETLEGISHGLARPCKRPRVLCGDFNLPRQERRDGTIVTFGQDLLPCGVARCWGRWRGDTGKRWDAAERGVLLGLAEHDLHDVYRLLNGYRARDVSHVVGGPDGGRRSHAGSS